VSAQRLEEIGEGQWDHDLHDGVFDLIEVPQKFVAPLGIHLSIEFMNSSGTPCGAAYEGQPLRRRKNSS